MRAVAFFLLTILTIGSSFGGNTGSNEGDRESSPGSTRLKTAVLPGSGSLQDPGDPRNQSLRGRGVLPPSASLEDLTNRGAGSYPSAFKRLGAQPAASAAPLLGNINDSSLMRRRSSSENLTSPSPDLLSSSQGRPAPVPEDTMKPQDCSDLPSASFLWPQDLPLHLPLMARRGTAPSNQVPAAVKKEKGHPAVVRPTVRRRAHATWRDYEKIPEVSPGAAFIGERDVLKEFANKEMLRRCHGRFIVNPGFSLKEWLEPHPELKSTLSRVLDRLWEEGKVKKKTFVSMRQDLRVFMHKLLPTYTDYKDEHDDFMRLLLRLLERKRGEPIVVEIGESIL